MLTFAATPAAGRTVIATVNGSAVSSSTRVAPGANVVITAAQNPGYNFDKYTNASGTTLSASNPYSFTMPATNTLVLTFHMLCLLHPHYKAVCQAV